MRNQTNSDLVFLKHFSIVMAGLVVLALALILGALYIHHAQPRDPDPSMARVTMDRIAPAGAVYAGATGAAAQAAAAAAAAQAATATAAYGGTLEGSVIYDNLCSGCHRSGVGGAPTLDPSHWTARIAKGTETLYDHAIHGFNAMPAKGGNPALTDEQVKVTVDWMLAQAK